MSDNNLGESVAKAVRFMEDIHSDTRRLFESLDEQLGRVGWLPVKENQVTWDLSGGLKKGILSWQAWHLFRAYKSTPAAESERFVVVQAHFAPPRTAGHTFASILGTAVRYPKPMSAANIFVKFESCALAYRDALSAVPKDRLTREEFEPMFPGAAWVMAVAHPLCSFTGTADLHSRLVEPLLKAFDRPEAK